jgi:hypothetical protein
MGLVGAGIGGIFGTRAFFVRASLQIVSVGFSVHDSLHRRPGSGRPDFAISSNRFAIWGGHARACRVLVTAHRARPFDIHQLQCGAGDAQFAPIFLIPIRSFPGALMMEPSRVAKRRLDSLIGVRLHPDDVAALDAWVRSQADQPSRPEAMRRLLRAALSGKRRVRQPA